MSDTQLPEAVTSALCVELNASLRRIHHCLHQLTDEQIAWRPHESMNSIANLVLHLCGNVGQWVIAGVGGAEDARDRQAEFDDRRAHTRDELLVAIDTAVAEACAVISASSSEELARLRVVQGRKNISGVHAIVHAVTHFQGHMQEIAHMTRILTGDDYVFAFVPERGPAE